MVYISLPYVRDDQGTRSESINRPGYSGRSPSDQARPAILKTLILTIKYTQIFCSYSKIIVND
jgi:hypothetical protein